MTATTIDMKLEAEKLVKLGYKVFPCCWPAWDNDGNVKCGCGRKDKYGNSAPHTGHDIGKAPLTKHGFLDATDNLLGVRDYWGKWPLANIGIPADNLLYLDFDADHMGLESRAILEAKEGDLPKTRVDQTGGGGEHWYYKQPKDCFIGNSNEFGGYPGFDTRGDNKGYVIVPPSLHISGKRYVNTDDSPIADCPEFIIRLWKEHKAKNSKGLSRGNTTTDEKIPQGMQNSWLYRRACSYRAWGDTEDIIIEKLKLDLRRCPQNTNDPFTEQNLIRIAQSACSKPPNRINDDRFLIVGNRQILRARGVPCLDK